MRAVNLIPIDEPAAQEVMLVPVDEGAGNGSPSIIQRNAFIQSQADNPDQYIQQLSRHQVSTGYQTPDRAVVGMASPQDQQAADTFKREYVQKPASGVLGRAVRAIKLYAFPVAKAIDSINGNENHQARLNRDIEDLSGFIDQQQPGPEVGELGKFVRGVEELAPQVALGELGVANLLSSATADKGIDAVHQGIDPGTATVLAEKELLQNAAFMRAPQIGKTLPQSLAIGATVNPTLGTLGRAADRIILETAGYQQQADAVKVIDPQTMAHEAAMGVLFSVDGHARNSLAKAHQPAEQVRENALPTEGRAVELVPVDATEPAAAARPEAGLDPESAAALKWAAARLTDPAASKFERQSLKQMIAEPGRQELLRTYRRNQPQAEAAEDQQQKQTALPEAGREVELVPFDEQPTIGNKAPEPVFDVQTTPEQGAALKTQPAVQPAGQNKQIQQQPEAPNGTVEQIPAGKRGAADIYDLSLNPSQQRSLEQIRQAVSDGEAGGRVVIDQQGQGSTGQTMGYSSSFPDWFKNKGYGKTETLQTIDFALKGQGVTARQKIMLEDLLQSKRAEDTNQILQQRSQPAEVPAYHLNEGDSIKRNGELFKVTEVAPDGVTLKDGETIHLNHEQTINYDRGSLKDASGKLVKRSPEVVSVEDNPFLETPGLSPESGKTSTPSTDAETARQAAAQHLNEVIPETGPSVGLSVKAAPRRDDNLRSPDSASNPHDQARSADLEIEKRWQAAHGLSDGPGLIERGKAFLHRMLSEAQHFPSLDTSSFSGKRTADILRRFESSDVAAKAKTTEYLHSLTASFGPKKMDIFTRKVILDDLIHEADKGRALPFGYTPETVKADHDRISKLVEANPDIKAAVERRAEVGKHLVLELVDNNLLPVESVLTPQGLEKFKTTGKYSADDINTQYFRHQVLEYANARKWAGISTAGEVRNKQRGWQKGREGSELDINTNFLEAEFEYHAQALKELATKKALEEVLSINDIAPELREQAKKEKVSDWKTLIPEGHTVWQPEQGSVFYKGKTLPESIITKFLEQNPAFQDTMKKFKEVLIMGGRKEEVVIPEGLAKTLDNLRSSRDDATLDTINKKLLATWKINTLLNPHRLLKYNLNNMSGDMDIVLAADPGIMKHFGTAWKNALNRHTGRAMGKDEIDMLDRGVIDAGLSINEIPDIAKLPGFQHLKDNARNVKLLEAIRTGNLAHLAPLNLIKRYFDTVHGLSQVREGLLREAAYLRAKELMEQGKTIYWASKPAEINNKDKAAKLSRELLGDYGNISAHGEKIRHSLIPFWSWMEINAPRYYRLLQNAATRGEGGSTAARLAGVGTRKAAGAALGIAEKVFLTNLLFASVSAFNHLMYPDEEARLGDNNRGMHIIMGSTSDGKIMSVKFQGAMADALSWFGLEDWPTSWEKLQNDQMSAGDLFRKMALATPNKLANAAAPFFKLGAELITGKQIFPDITQPKPIRDRAEHVARFLALDEEYKALAGKPTKGYLDSLKRNLIYEGDPGEIAYQDTRQRVMQFMKKQGKEIPGGEPTERANALFYFKQAVRYGDSEAAARYKQEYLQAGGKLEGIRKSIDKAHPLALLPENMRYKFRQSLSPEEDQAFKEGLSWYKQVYNP